MDERMIRERLQTTAGSFRLSSHDSDRVVRRARIRVLAVQIVGAGVVVGAVLGLGAVMGSDTRIAPQPLPPVGPGPTISPSFLVPSPLDIDYVIDLDDGSVEPLPRSITRITSTANEGPADRLAVTPDGSKIAFVGSDDQQRWQIFVAEMDGSGVRRVTDDPRGTWSPAWSPDGAQIAYVGYGDGTVRNVFVVDVATTEVRQITDRSRHVWPGVQFTPDGSSVTYDGGTALVPAGRIVDLDSGEDRVWLEPAGALTDVGAPVVSPDGSLVTFIGGFDGGPGPRRWIAGFDGTELRELRADCWEMNPAGTWSPDGRSLVCSNDVGRVVIVDVETGATRQVAEGVGAVWLDERRLVVAVCDGQTACDRPVDP